MNNKKITYQLVSSCLLATSILACGGGGGGGGSGPEKPASNQSPTIVGQPPGKISEFSEFDFTPMASDPNGDALTFSVENLPDWLEFNETTGQLIGFADGDSAGVYSDIQITVSDGSLSRSLTFSLEVTEAVEVSGVVINGYISGAQVYLDSNLNGNFDPDSEPNGVSDNAGAFKIVLSEDNFSVANFAPIRAHLNGNADDLSRGSDNFMDNPVTLSAIPLSNLNATSPQMSGVVVSPINSLITSRLGTNIQQLVDGDISLAEFNTAKINQIQIYADYQQVTSAQIVGDYLSSNSGLSNESATRLSDAGLRILRDFQDIQNPSIDTDSDGVSNHQDLDVDGDGVNNPFDDFPLDNSEQTDTDNDGIGNNADLDDDNDGVLDEDDDFPLDPNLSSADDQDSDNWPAGQDPDDADNTIPGIPFVDTDGDGFADEGGLLPDNDDDNDGVLDVDDAFPLDPTESVDTDGDGIGNNSDLDDDGDLIADTDDAFPLDPNETTDTDGDGVGNNADPDDDNDGILDENDPTPLGDPALTSGPLSFANITSQSGLSHVWGVTALEDKSSMDDYEILVYEVAGGMTAGDYDQDGDIDIFVTAGDYSPSKLYQNIGNNQFVDVAQQAGVKMDNLVLSGAGFFDEDNDGDLDLFVASADSPQTFFFRNLNGAFQLIDSSESFPLTKTITLSSAFGDYDRDGDLDIYLAHWGELVNEDLEHLWRNRGDGTYESVNIPAGVNSSHVEGSRDYTFAPGFADINDDRYPDLLMAADFTTTSMHLNNKDGTFNDNTDSMNITIDDLSGMGSSIADIDNDGDLDWFVTSIFSYNAGTGFLHSSGNKLFKNHGAGTFADVSIETDIIDGGWGWASCIADFNNDTLPDIFMVNGSYDANGAGIGTEPFEDDSVRLWMQDSNGNFVESAAEFGLTDRGQGRGVLCYDTENDGDVDIIIMNHDEDINSLVFYENENGNNIGNYLNILLRDQSTNTFAIGAKVTITTGGIRQTKEVNLNSNFVSHNPTNLHFGIGHAETIDEIEIFWPDGTRQVYQDIAKNQSLTIERGN